MNDGNGPVEVAELSHIVQAAEPAALLLPPRLLRRIIKTHSRVAGFSRLVPHRKSLVIPREDLLRIVSADELGLMTQRQLGATVLLLAAPTPSTLAVTPRQAILLKYWRLLFHVRIHLALEGRFDKADIQDRVRLIGEAEYEEVRTVLRQDGYLLAPDDDRAVYVEFAAVYLELRSFARPCLADYFPALVPFERIDWLLNRDVDADRLFAATRLAGAPDPACAEEVIAEAEVSRLPEEKPTGQVELNYRLFKRLMRRAKRAGARQNAVRSAIAKAQAARVGQPKRAEETRAEARVELEHLATRIQAAVGLETQNADQWRKGLEPLLPLAARDSWPPEARLLYDLQKACIDHEKQLYVVDLVEWAISLGRRPIRRPVPCQREVLRLRHLRSAARRLKATRLIDPQRRRLAALLEPAVRNGEDQLRGRLQPLLQGTLEEVGLRPRNLPEHVALHKLTEELLDRVVEHGYLNMGDVRDALSRNNFKLADLAGPREFFAGDRLIRANRRLAASLDGVYRRGEIYLRWLQRFSALAFGNPVGRFVTLYAVLPFGGAFVALEGLQHAIDAVLHLMPAEVAEVPAPAASDIDGDFEPLPLHEPAVHLVTPVTVAVFGVVFFLLLHSPQFRRWVAGIWKLLYGLLHGLCVDLPAYFLRLPMVQAILRSRPVVLLGRYVAKPLGAAAPAAALLRLAGASPTAAVTTGLATFALSSLLLNTRIGRDLEEAVIDRLVWTWQRIQYDLLPGLFRLVMDVFKRLVEAVDRFLYRVDEWLRFRQGDPRLTVAVKAVLGLAWFVVTYLVRIYVNLLIEPTINPIKHFPVVTVAAKIMLPFTLPMMKVFTAQLDMLGPVLSRGIAILNITLLPGFFGFLVWELKENWRLYAANRPLDLMPVVIGSHGETMIRLLRPGIHSGTVPKLYAKLRKANRAALRRGDWRAVRKQREALHHVEERVRHFVERDLVFLLLASNAWGARGLQLTEVRLATNVIRAELSCLEVGQGDLAIALETQEGQLAAAIIEEGWTAGLAPDPRRALALALAGLYKMVGVDQIREPPNSLAYRDVSLRWQFWVESWERAQQNEDVIWPLAEEVRIMPGN